MTSVGAAHGGEAVVQRLHRALPGAAEAGREAARVDGEADRTLAGDERRGRGRRGVAKTGLRSQAVTKAAIPSRSMRSARASSAARRAARSPGSAIPADGLSRTRRSTASGWATARRSAIRAPSE